MADEDDVRAPKRGRLLQDEILKRRRESIEGLEVELASRVDSASETPRFPKVKRFRDPGLVAQIDYVVYGQNGKITVLEAKGPRHRADASDSDAVQPVAMNRAPSLEAPKPPRLEVQPPGRTLGRVLAILLTRKAYRRYVYPAIADMQAEFLEALQKGHRAHAWWIAIRGHLLVMPGWIYALIGGWIVKKFIT